MGLATEHLDRTAVPSRSARLLSVRHPRRVTASLVTETLVLLLPALIFALMAFGMPEDKAPPSAQRLHGREIGPRHVFAAQTGLAGRR